MNMCAIRMLLRGGLRPGLPSAGPGKILRIVWACIMASLAVLHAAPAAADSAGHEPYILVTGFEPFGGEKINSSWEAVRHLDGVVLAGRKIVARQLPVVWEQASARLEILIRKYHPVAVVAFGEAGGEGEVRIETLAKNVRGQYRDNDDRMPPASYISKNGEASLPTGLDAELTRQRLVQAGIPARLSDDAGDYLCNETFYNLMGLAKKDASAAMPAGFVHVPSFNARGTPPVGLGVQFDRVTLEKTADIVVRTVIGGLGTSEEGNKPAPDR